MAKISNKFIALSVLLGGLLSGCSSLCLNNRPTSVATTSTNCTPSCVQPGRRVYAIPAKFYAVGYGSEGNYAQYTVGQKRLMAMRAAEVDAYRKLAEQVNGLRISGTTTVSSFAVQNDSLRTYVEAYIRGARITNMTAIADGNFQATVELDMSDSFGDCIVGVSDCNSRNISRECGTVSCETGVVIN